MNEDKMAKAIEGVLVNVAEKLSGHRKPDNEWTQEILVSLGNLGKRKNDDFDFYVCSHGFGVADWEKSKDWSEWLFDQSWLEYEKDEFGKLQYLKRMAMAMESEWGDEGDIKDDFEKLLVARADLRVMIFQAKNAEEVGCLFDRLKYLESKYEARSGEDKYLFAGFNMETGKFEIVRIPEPPTKTVA